MLHRMQSLLTVNMTEIEPESSMQYYYDGYDYEVPTGNYGDHIMFIGAECVQYSLATEAGGPAVPGAILVQADVWAGANALERLPDYVNFSNAPGALPASQCPGQCTDMNVATSPAVPYLMLLMTDGMPGGEYDSYTINLTTYGPSAPGMLHACGSYMHSASRQGLQAGQAMWRSNCDGSLATCNHDKLDSASNVQWA